MLNLKLTPIEMNYALTKQKPFINAIIPEHENMKKMYQLASMLSKQFEFVRIDFYIGKNNEIYFSEYTFFPFGCNMNFSEEAEKILGNKWN